MNYHKQYQKKQLNFREINNHAFQYLDRILDKFGLEFQQINNFLIGSCPIHDGDNTSAFNLYLSGDYSVGNWVCNTHHCEEEYSKYFLGFIQGLLSKSAGRKVSLYEVIDWLDHDLKLDCSKIDHSDKSLFINKYKEKIEQEEKVYDAGILSLLSRPQYYIDRGFSADILKKFNVGYCGTPNKYFYQRCVVPVFNLKKQIVGFTGRTTHDKCSKCGGYHDLNKKCWDVLRKDTAKWIHSDNFKCGNYLYNAQNINGKTIVLTEGPGDVWRLTESGILNSVGLFGCKITENQIKILQQINPYNIVLALDNDEAGIQGKQKIKGKLERYYNLIDVDLAGKDAGDLSVDQLTSIFIPILKKCERFEYV